MILAVKGKGAAVRTIVDTVTAKFFQIFGTLYDEI